jgi:hypothetical protein
VEIFLVILNCNKELNHLPTVFATTTMEMETNIPVYQMRQKSDDKSNQSCETLFGLLALSAV